MRELKPNLTRKIQKISFYMMSRDGIRERKADAIGMKIDPISMSSIEHAAAATCLNKNYSSQQKNHFKCTHIV